MENILVSTKGEYKIIDFGSCSNDVNEYPNPGDHLSQCHKQSRCWVIHLKNHHSSVSLARTARPLLRLRNRDQGWYICPRSACFYYVLQETAFRIEAVCNQQTIFFERRAQLLSGVGQTNRQMFYDQPGSPAHSFRGEKRVEEDLQHQKNPNRPQNSDIIRPNYKLNFKGDWIKPQEEHKRGWNWYFRQDKKNLQPDNNWDWGLDCRLCRG